MTRHGVVFVHRLRSLNSKTISAMCLSQFLRNNNNNNNYKYEHAHSVTLTVDRALLFIYCPGRWKLYKKSNKIINYNGYNIICWCIQIK